MKRRHWYFITFEDCPVCGHGKEYRERRFTPKPKDPAKRYQYRHYWDYCNT